MRTVHVLRKYDTAEWGGTESAVKRLLGGLEANGVESVMYCPRPQNRPTNSCGATDVGAIKYFNAQVPVWGLSDQEKRQFVAVGGNLFSFDLLPALWKEREVHVVHAHTLGRLGAIAGAAARQKKVPFVVTIHGGFLDLPAPMKKDFSTPSNRGFDWGRIFGLLLRSRQLLEQADALLTCNPTEAALLKQRFPGQRVQVQPHGISVATYEADSREIALDAWPQLRGRQVLLCVGRIDSVKNQRWVVEQAKEIFTKHRKAILVLAGPSTDLAYSGALETFVSKHGLNDRILLTGGLAPNDRRLIGLFQIADVVLLPSLSETFGLVLLEAWAAGTAVISSRTSGPAVLIDHGENGWLFDLQTPETFHAAVDLVLNNPNVRAQAAAAGKAKVIAEYDLKAVANRIRQLYHQLIEAKSCAT
ncbi:MAG TPA: glycosyltransferase family 4 protein [Verrucomicrobiae bacterium]|nr:glycosyltransferase family 4 protein [Verrucomicrobiae bacterium]